MESNTNEILNGILQKIECTACEEDQEGILSAFNEISQEFWKDSECFLPIMDAFYSNVRFEMYVFPIDVIPDFFWDNEDNVMAYVQTLCGFYEEQSIDFNLDELLPRRFLENKAIAKLLLNVNCDETLSYISDELKSEADIMLAALEGLINKIEYREYNATSWLPPYDKSECLEEFVAEIPDALASNKDFILGFLSYRYYFDELDSLYEWVDKALWSDKSFVLEVCSANSYAVKYVSDMEIVLEVLSADNDAIEFVSDDLYEDADFKQRVKEDLQIEL